jgi:hypothetical protein
MVLSACATPTAVPIHSSVNEFDKSQGKIKLLILPLRIALFHSPYIQHPFGRSPSFEKHREWTKIGKKNVKTAIEEFLLAENISAVFYPGEEFEKESHTQFSEISIEVVNAMFRHYQDPHSTLPAKKEADWSVGEAAMVFKEEFDADYVLSIGIQDYFWPKNIFKWGGPIAPSGSVAFIVNLESGEIIWLDNVRGSSGDIRKKEGAQKAVRTLLRNFPQ